MKVLVVGGAGYVGGAVTSILAETGHETRVYDLLLYEESYRKQVDFAFGDVRDRARLKPHLDWADAVIWLAAVVGDGACALNPEATVEINQDSVRWLAESFDGRIAFLSTCSVYGAQDAVLDEDSPINPLSVYASTKLHAEKYLEDSNAIVFRLGTLFGVSDLYSRVRLDLVVNTLTVRAATQGKFTIFGGGQYRPLLHVHDAAQAVVDSLEQEATGLFNLHKENTTIIDLAERVRAHFPGVEIERTPMEFKDARNYSITSDKAKSELGFDPRLEIDDGIEEVKALVLSHRIKDVDNPRYTNQKYLAMFDSHLDADWQAP